LVIACDGLWDVVSDEEAISIAAHFLQSTRQPEEAAKRLRNIAYGRGSTDNITVLVAVLQSPSMGIKKSSSCIIL
jgi:serine/threonine protein phosphatase PrpC